MPLVAIGAGALLVFGWFSVRALLILVAALVAADSIRIGILELRRRKKRRGSTETDRV